MRVQRVALRWYKPGRWRGELLADDFYEDAFAAAAIELAVKDLFPGSEIELSFGNGDDDFASHDLAFHVGIGVIFAGAVVFVLGGGGVRCEFLEPDIVIVMQPAFVIIDENGGGDVHRVHETEPFLHAAFAHEVLHRAGDVDETAAAGDFEPELFGKRFHGLRNSSFTPNGQRLPKQAERLKVESESCDQRRIFYNGLNDWPAFVLISKQSLHSLILAPSDSVYFAPSTL